MHGRGMEGATSIIPHSGNGQNKENKSSRSWDLGLGSPICHFRLQFITRAGMNSLPSLPRLTAAEAAAAIWPKLGSNIGTTTSNLYLECGIPAFPLVVLIAAATAAGRRNEWRRFEAEGERQCKDDIPAFSQPRPRRRNDREPTSIHMGWLLTAHRVTAAGHGQ